ncbi:sugar ABC transporter ATP-binding protein [Tissierella carlieri]|jgi:ribose transport system ATP-binding protein|uniref:sugar ABC transporter ATP-binding protein n=1 Tax=Tissierella carlieri TaxID=689904 RepID=UPI002803EFCF|nr:ATP-binding cassette domain-containing protein [uncultured Tissierella sp.]MDU5080358.1 sugar ABC transporter ATP-binding protein [Bacillota bacterium]
MGKPILVMEMISKSFPGVKALDSVNFTVYENEVMALLGENGAGKSTLMKILSGVYKRDSGQIILEGQPVEMISPKDATDKGIAIIHQELNLIPYLTVYENIFLGRELKLATGVLNKREMIRQSDELLRKLKVNINPNVKVNTLSIAQQQMVEIAKALSLNAKIIIMDEPTDTLTDQEVENLFEIIRELKKEGKGIVYISHRLKEVFEICDKLTVLRDGQFIAEKKVSEVDEDEIIRLMVGRTLEEQFPYIKTNFQEEVLNVENLSNEYIKDIGFTLRKGEILGISGLVGAGRTELAKTLYGVYKKDRGTVTLDGEKVNLRTPKEALDKGIVYVSEDRKHDGLILMMDVRSNMTISALEKFKRFLGIDKKKENRIASEYREKINIKTPSLHQKVQNLSGGNQQKVAIAKSLLTDPKVLILDEPTRGVDVGAKKEIYDLLNKIKEEGRSIIMISSEMPEILGMSDRILVMHEGQLRGEISREEATQEKIMSYIVRGEDR